MTSHLVADQGMELPETVRHARPQLDHASGTGILVEKVHPILPYGLELPQRHNAHDAGGATD
jgi:hypothetical protein